jgi:hypothetical protein
MDATAVAIFNAAVPYNGGTAGASAQDQIGRNRRAGNGAPTAPGGTGPGTGTGLGGTTPGATGTGTRGNPGGTAGSGVNGAGTGPTGAGNGAAGTGTGNGAGPAGTTGTGTTGTGGTGTTGAGTTPGTSAPTTPTTGVNPGAATGPGSTTTPGAATGPGTATGTAGGTAATDSATGTTASPGIPSRRTPSTGPGVDWTRIQGDYHTITSTWSSARATVRGQGADAGLLTAVDAQISTLGSAINSRNAMGTAMAANDLTAYTTTLLGLYRPATPVQIYQMEYLAREVELDTENGNAEGALDGARGVGGVWASLRTVAMARSRAHASAVDADVARLANDVASGANLNLRSDAATLLRDLQILTRDFLTANPR